MTETVTEMHQTANAMVSEVTKMIAWKIQDQAGVSSAAMATGENTGHGEHKLDRGVKERAVSQLISETMSPKKVPDDMGAESSTTLTCNSPIYRISTNQRNEEDKSRFHSLNFSEMMKEGKPDLSKARANRRFTFENPVRRPNGDRVKLKCIYCGKVFSGGGIHRIKEHLAGQKGNAASCLRVQPDVQRLMQQSLDGVVVKKKKKQKIVEEITNLSPVPSEIDSFAAQNEVNTGFQLVAVPNTLELSSSLLAKTDEGITNQSLDRRKRGRVRNSSPLLVAPDPISNITLGSTRVNTQVHMAIGRFLYDVGAPLDAVNSIYFQPMIDAIASEGPGLVAPSYHDLRGWILKNSVEEAMVTSQEWMDCPYSKKPGGLAMIKFISSQSECSNSFWSSCSLIIRLMDPLLRVLRMVSSEKRPAMAYIYAGIYRAKEAIKKELVKKKDCVVYWKIIDHRWDRKLHCPLHAAGFYLNPKFFYSIEGDVHNEISSGMLDCIERLVPDIKIQDKIIKELNAYKNAVGDFGRKMAIRARDTLLPVGRQEEAILRASFIQVADMREGEGGDRGRKDFFLSPHYNASILDSHSADSFKMLIFEDEWWSTYGGGCPNLARLATRILSQTCSAIVCKHNHIPLEKIQYTRNCLEHQRLNDLVVVQYNLRLRHILGKNKELDPLDPISFDIINTVEDWVTEKDVLMGEFGSSDWMALDQPVSNTMLLGSSNDEAEGFDTGFEDDEIYNGIKDEEEENVEGQ
ncbi:hypothetical protein HHK36_019093 [Tetracentron sinense]|uniref:HAT C-terminal dimerisation domain-containing protein n=1 Tax=Tetracentron sinense TaxID=13715 RepID=A0A834Z1M1_TETSI|nr:hypothetical protein HHK36_019093 [Tetracentron sinense]